MAVGLAEATLISLLMESILFGIFTVLFLATLYILIMRRKSQQLRIHILAVSVCMYVLALMHLAVDMHRAIVGFVGFSDSSQSEVYFNALSNSTSLFKNGILIAQILLGDGFVIYRLYMVWFCDKRIAAPAILCLLASFCVGVITLKKESEVTPTTLVFNDELKLWVTSFFSMTLITNFSCTALIAFRIWRIELRTSAMFRLNNSLSPVMVAIIESGAIYSATLISLLATYLSGSDGQYPVLDSIAQIIGVVFSLIIVRIGLGISSKDTTHHGTTSIGPINFSSQRPLRPVSVHMTRTRTALDDQGETLGMSRTVSVSSNTAVDLESKVNASRSDYEITKTQQRI
ncbi:hypothetical protein DFH11DRAFT_1642709 [Phellopilus nigrolimitatus]|nr:hypothetical protein DFH11DRAFT_1642709 [Phellopilus nigrolimitatus]